MTRWLTIFVFLSFLLTSSLVWAHGGNDHVLGTVTETTEDHIIVKTPKGESISITIHSNTSFQHNGIATKDARPQVGDRLVAEVSKDGDQFVGKEIRFATPKSK